MTALPNAAPFPPGDLRRLYLHWTAGDYATTFPAYHFCIALGADAPRRVATHDLRANMRDVRANSATPYAAHTAGRNAYAVGIAICGMEAAVPSDFGPYPLRGDLVAAACALAAELCDFYRIPIDAQHVATHAEAALEDGYFGSGDDQRWDIARLWPEPRALASTDAAATGNALRALTRG
ncbi:MAG: N-acetylmuramoyl-L-alanine amidase [Candidatus Eremiobacteraeota bacterium]|nr:N-acetylmuramoyl-L-alanine amidase [Candidatus Eremiobacteraeota bacterium]